RHSGGPRRARGVRSPGNVRSPGTSTHRLKLLDWNGNMAAHLIYWPIVTVLLFAAILAVFVV
ncbi:hypothetical protein, partial [Kitasatospora sp. NPDC093558]|uniref:hypothetical protein n=1 Tax=Kitasatospora sp. NPDC093558 TaxID=3155201 RepID=UPI00341CCE3F